MYRNEIDAYFAQHRDDLLRDIGRLIAIKSVREDPKPDMPYGEGPYKALRAACAIAEALGFTVRSFDNHVLTAEMGPQPAELGILAHLDVVPEGAGWTYEPYRMIEDGGKIYGRGVSDDKGPAVVALYAAVAAKAIAPQFKKGVRIILGTAEETGSEDLEHYFKQETPPPFSFSPDAGYPVINIEKGSHSPIFSQSWPEDKALPRVSYIHGGVTKNIVTREAYALTEGLSKAEVDALCAKHAQKTGVRFTVSETDTGLRIDALGVSAHAAHPSDGKNAQTALLALLAELPLADSACARAIRSLHELFPYGDDGGNAIGVAQKDDISGELTLVFSVLELTPTGFSGRYDSRVPICATWETMGSITVNALKAKGFDVTSTRMKPPHHTPADLPFVKTLLKVYEDYTGNKGECIAIGGGTYVHDIEGGVAFGCELPGTDNHIHGADEFAIIDELLLSGRMFTQIILDMCC
ncbi:MAG: Sapep family Mn(2+)-dependent dipeptidase [Clostridiaceae bacterium]|nr:Sapep family Mn(2+)-dependent dipeptidase [Clostridiaceae bacterium]